MEFQQWLQLKMDEHGFTKYRIAKMADVHQSTVAGWLRGAKPQVEKENMVRAAIKEFEDSHSKKSSTKKEVAPEGDWREEAVRLFSLLSQDERDRELSFLRERTNGRT